MSTTPEVTQEHLFQLRRKIGAELRAIREAKGITQEQLGERIGMGKDRISKIEAGHWNYGVNTLNMFLIALEEDLKIDPAGLSGVTI